MPKSDAEQTARYADMLAALGAEPRLRIVRLLLAAHPEGLVVGEIGSELGIPPSTLSHHLDKLKNEGLVSVRREGTFLCHTANTGRFRKSSGSSSPSAAPATRRSAPKPSLAPAHRRKAMSDTDIKETVRERYAEIARSVRAPGVVLLRWGSRDRGAFRPISTLTMRPAACPKRRCWRRWAAAIRPRSPNSSEGETVLDLGSGGGIDVLLSARRVGPTGKAYGLDMTDDMLALARENQQKGGRGECRVPEGRDRSTSRCRTTPST